MRLCADKPIFFFLALLLVLAAGSLGAETQCKCRNPPGGSHGCENQQVAYCKIENGQCVGWCGSKKTPKKRGDELVAAILSEGLDENVTEQDLREDPEYQVVYTEFLKSGYLNGSYLLEKDLKVVFVQVPSTAQVKLSALSPDVPKKRHWFWPTSPDGQQIDDATITAAIKAKIATDGDINPFNIDVDTAEGIVTLQGRVSDSEARSQAERLARETEGVKRVVNLIKVGDWQ